MLRKGYVFTGVCLSTGGKGGRGVYIPWAYHPRQISPPPAITPGQTHPTQTPAWADPPPDQTATAADGTHPTGMHSCFL